MSDASVRPTDQVLGSLPGRVSVDVGLHEKTRPTYLSRASGKPYLLSKKAVTNRYTHLTLTLPTYRQRQTGINGYPTRQGAEDLWRSPIRSPRAAARGRALWAGLALNEWVPVHSKVFPGGHAKRTDTPGTAAGPNTALKALTTHPVLSRIGATVSSDIQVQTGSNY